MALPSVKSFETDMRRARRKKRAKRNIKNFSFILAVLIIAGLIYLSRDAWLNFFDGILERHSDSAVQNDGALAGGNYPIDISKKTHTGIGKVAGSWTLFADTSFYVYDSSGNLKYTEQAPYSNPIVAESEKRTLVYDQGGYNFMLAGQRDKIYSKKVTDQILLGAVGDDGSVAIVTANEKYLAYLTVYDKGGSEIYHWADGSMITAVALKPNGKGCLVSSSYARGGTFQSVVTELSFSSTEIVMKTAALETLGFCAAYTPNGCCLLGRDRFYRLNSEGSIEMNFGYDYELLNYYVGKSLAALVFEGAGGSGGMLSIISFSGEEVKNVPISGTVKDVYCTDKAIYILTDTSVEAYGSGGDLLATAPLGTVYREFSVIDDEIFLLGYRSVEKIEFSI